MSNRKIKEWEAEIEKITENQKQMIAKNNEKIKQLRKKIEEAKRNDELENNKMIADLVRQTYGEVNEKNIERFRQLMESFGHSIQSKTS